MLQLDMKAPFISVVIDMNELINRGACYVAHTRNCARGAAQNKANELCSRIRLRTVRRSEPIVQPVVMDFGEKMHHAWCLGKRYV